LKIYIKKKKNKKKKKIEGEYGLQLREDESDATKQTGFLHCLARKGITWVTPFFSSLNPHFNGTSLNHNHYTQIWC
jgi:hypothetical protein